MPTNLSASGGLLPPDPLTRSSALDPAGGSAPRPPYRSPCAPHFQIDPAASDHSLGLGALWLRPASNLLASGL